MDFNSFINEVSKTFRLGLTSYKETQLKRRIDNLLVRNNAKDYGDYFKILQNNSEVLDAFTDYLTINVSEFFRNPKMFEILEEKILPEILKNNRNLKIWSAACSNGSEPYSIAMILAEIAKDRMYQIEATDLDKLILQRAEFGAYTKEELKNISSDRQKRHFRQNGDKFLIDPSIKRKIRFKRHDLLLDPYPKGFHLIVCRNVMIYFTKEAQDQINSRFSESLEPGGYLFIGGTESIFQYKKLGLEKVATCFYRKL